MLKPESEILKSLDGAILLVASDGEILFCNEGSRAVLGGDLLGRLLTDLDQMGAPSLLASIASSYRLSLESDGNHHDLVMNENDTGPRYYWLTIAKGLQGRRVVSVEEISEAFHDLPDVAKVMPRLIHDLRTPLTAIAGAAELLLGGRLGPVGTVHQRMVNIIDDGARKMKEMLIQTEAEIAPSATMVGGECHRE